MALEALERKLLLLLLLLLLLAHHVAQHLEFDALAGGELARHRRRG